MRLALASLWAHRGRSLAVIVGLATALLLPITTWLAESRIEPAVMDRARATPIVLGRRGSDVDLVVAALYFRGGGVPSIDMATIARWTDGRDLEVIPVHTGFTAAGRPFVGTTAAWFARHGVRVAEGRLPAVLGEVVIGADVARDGVVVGAHLTTDQADLYDLGGTYPIQLRVVGVLHRTGGPEDGAVLGDIKTAWLAAGLMHGHAAASGEADGSLFLFTEVSEDNLGTFHLHGGPADWPATAALIYPRTARAHDQLLGDAIDDPTWQAARPAAVMGVLLGVILRVRPWLVAYGAAVATATALLLAVLTGLVVQLRRAEIALYRRLGASRGRVAAILGAEVATLVVSAIALAAALAALAVAWARAALGV